MNRKEFTRYIAEQYNCVPDYPWIKYPQNAVFRHANTGKWFALCMEISADKLGLEGKEPIQIVNLKCDPILIGSLRQEAGIYPAYHMNKSSWISVCLNDTVHDDKLRFLLDLSYELTSNNKRKGSDT